MSKRQKNEEQTSMLQIDVKKKINNYIILGLLGIEPDPVGAQNLIKSIRRGLHRRNNHIILTPEYKFSTYHIMSL